MKFATNSPQIAMKNGNPNMFIHSAVFYNLGSLFTYNISLVFFSHPDSVSEK